MPASQAGEANRMCLNRITLYLSMTKLLIKTLAICALIEIVTLRVAYATNESTCYGSTAQGKLRNGVQLPASGNNFESYSVLAGPLGRTYVHSMVAKVIVESYAELEMTQPGKKFKYAETGFKEGGKFKPHKTHQNGLSVDFIVPVIDKNGRSVYLPTNAFNQWGYAVEFDPKGHYQDFTIDFQSMAAHIVSLHKHAKKNGIDIWRVIFDPKLQTYLFNSKDGQYIKRHIKISKKKSWVRHDDHYHVDFKVKCRPLRD